jgi:hypothetical protein
MSDDWPTHRGRKQGRENLPHPEAASSPTERSTLVNDAKYIGLDVHQATISATVLDSRIHDVPKKVLWPLTKSRKDAGFSRSIAGGSRCRTRLKVKYGRGR